jgi:NAD-dependent SIR2 family protein deacetylase
LTTNTDALFHKAGFGKNKVFMVYDDYGKNQYTKGCHKILYDNEKLIKEMVLIPKCPVCGGNMSVTFELILVFVEDDEWEKLNFNYHKFLNKIKGSNIVLIEIGVGYNTPAIIKFPFEQMTFVEPHTET